MRRLTRAWLPGVFAIFTSVLGSSGSLPCLAEEPREGGSDETVSWKELTAGESKIRFYGFLRFDAIRDDTRPDNAQSPLFIRSEQDGTLENGSNLTMHPRLTRLGVDCTGPTLESLGGARLGGKIEFDFQAPGRAESRAAVRARHLYLTLAWKTTTFLAGQTWDLVSPLYPTANNDTLMWNAGNLGDRRAQLRLTVAPKVGGGELSFAGAAGLTGAVDSKDLDANDNRDGESSGKPNVQARIGYSHPMESAGGKLSFGVWGLTAWEETQTPVAGERTFKPSGAGVDFRIPILKWFSLQGEAWTGEDLSDFRGGIGQGVNTATGEEIESKGGWAELSVGVGSHLTFYPGFTLDDPDDEDISTGGRVKNHAWYLVNRFQAGKSFLAGLDYLRWVTDFKDSERGTDNRVNLYLQYSF